MESIKLNPQGDIDIKGGELGMVSGDDEIRQRIWIILSVNLSEWFLDLDYGLDYDVFMKEKIYSELEIRTAIEESVLQIEEVKRVDILDIRLNSERRILEIDMNVFTDDNILNWEEVLEIE